MTRSILLSISFEGRNITNCCRTKTSSPLRQRLTHSHSTQTGRKSSLPVRLTTPEADFTLQTADDCQPGRLPNTKRSRPRKARDQDGKSTSCARVHSRLPPHPRAVSRSGPRLHPHSTPASDALPGGPAAPQGLALLSSLGPHPQSIAESCSTNFRQLQQELGAGRIREENCSYTEGWERR